MSVNIDWLDWELEIIKAQENLFWHGFNILRGIVPSKDLDVYLFALSACYDGVINAKEFINANDPQSYLDDVLKNDSKYHADLLTYYVHILKQIPLGVLIELFGFLDRNRFAETDEMFSEVFERLLFKLLDNQGKSSNAEVLPREVTSFVNQLIDGSCEDYVFNPFGGIASFFDNDTQYQWQEKNPATWALGMLRLKRSRVEYGGFFITEPVDSIKHWPILDEGFCYELVISYPPLGMKVDSFFIGQNKASREIMVEEFIIEKGLESICNKGKVVTIGSTKFLYGKGSEAELRKRLVENGQIVTIVYFPSRLLAYSGTPFCMIIISPKKNDNEAIRMVDASKYVIDKGRRRALDTDGLLKCLNSSDDEDVVRYVNREEVRNNSYNLSVQRYLINKHEGLALGELLIHHVGLKCEKGTSGRLLTVKDLNVDNLNPTLKIGDIEVRKIPFGSKKLETSCLLVAFKGNSLKPTLFEYTGEPIYIQNDVRAFEIREQLVNKVFLMNELSSKNVTDQFVAFQNQGVIPFIYKEDFLRIKIQLPSPEEQISRVRLISEINEEHSKVIAKRLALVEGTHVKEFNEFASLKHSLGSPRQNILSTAKSLIRFFERHDSLAFEEVHTAYKERYDSNLLEDLNQIREDVNLISTVLEKGEKGLVLRNYDLNSLSVREINDILKRKVKNRGTFKPDFVEIKGREVLDQTIRANAVLFEILIDNILTNADKYAFQEASKNNEVVMELKMTDDMLELIIKNNGAPFPENFDKGKFIAKFSTLDLERGGGLGGYDINRIADYFNNPDWQLILDAEDLFPVIFKFNFPLFQ